MGNLQAAAADPNFIPEIHRTLKHLRQQEQKKHAAQVLHYETKMKRLSAYSKASATVAIAAAIAAAYLDPDATANSPLVWYLHAAAASLTLLLMLHRRMSPRPPPFYIPPAFLFPSQQAPEAPVELDDGDADAEPQILGDLSLQICGTISQLYHAHARATALSPRPIQFCTVQDLPAPLPMGVDVYGMAMTPAQRLRAIGAGCMGKVVAGLVFGRGDGRGKAPHKMILDMLRHIAAVCAAATPEGLFEEGGRLYDAGQYQECAAAYKRAAAAGHTHARSRLAELLIAGRQGVRRDESRAFKLAAAGAQIGCMHCIGVLARCYISGFGVPKDAAKGFELGIESAEAGSITGLFAVGLCYYNGDGVDQDYNEAVRLLSRSARLGHACSVSVLATMAFNGFGCKQSDEQAVRLYVWGASLGDAMCQVCKVLMLQYAMCLTPHWQVNLGIM